MTAVAAPGTSSGATTGAPRRWAALTLVLLPVGPACVAGLRFLLPYFSPDSPEFDAVAASPGRESAVLWLGFAAVLTLVPGVVLAARLTRRAAPVLTAAALALLVPAYLDLTWVFAGDVAVDGAVRAGLSPAAGTALLAHLHPVVDVGTGVFVAGHVLGSVLLGVALLRSHAVPVWAGWAMTVSQPVHVLAAVVLVLPWLDLAGWSLTAVAMGVVAVALWRRSGR